MSNSNPLHNSTPNETNISSQQQQQEPQQMDTSQLISTLISSQQSIQQSLSKLERETKQGGSASSWRRSSSAAGATGAASSSSRPASANRAQRHLPHFMQSTQNLMNRSQTPEVRRKVARVKNQRQKRLKERRRQSMNHTTTANSRRSSVSSRRSLPQSLHASNNMSSSINATDNASTIYHQNSSFIKNLVSQKERIHIDVSRKTIGDLSVVMGLGTISVPNYKLTSLEGLPQRDDLKTLYLQNNFLTSFKYLGVQPNLEFIHATENCIASFYAFEHQPKLKTIDLGGNPITKHPHYRLMCLMCAGTQIKTIDDEPVKFKEREFVKKFVARNPLAVDALRAGWLLDMKIRSEDEFRQVIQRMQSIDMDDRNIIRHSEVYQNLTSGNLRIGTESIKPNPTFLGSSLEFSGMNDQSSLIDMNLYSSRDRSSQSSSAKNSSRRPLSGQRRRPSTAKSDRKKAKSSKEGSARLSSRSSQQHEIASRGPSPRPTVHSVPVPSATVINGAPTLRVSAGLKHTAPALSRPGLTAGATSAVANGTTATPSAGIKTNPGSKVTTATATEYMEEIRRLRQDLTQRNEALKTLKEKTQEMQTNTVSIDTLLYFTSLEIKGFIYTTSSPLSEQDTTKVKVVTALTKDFLHLSDMSTIEEVRAVQLIEIAKTSLLMESNQLYKLHLQVHSGEDFDLICKNRKLALALYKTLHLYIGEANRRKRIRRQQAKLEQERLEAEQPTSVSAAKEDQPAPSVENHSLPTEAVQEPEPSVDELEPSTSVSTETPAAPHQSSPPPAQETTNTGEDSITKEQQDDANQDQVQGEGPSSPIDAPEPAQAETQEPSNKSPQRDEPSSTIEDGEANATEENTNVDSLPSTTPASEADQQSDAMPQTPKSEVHPEERESNTPASSNNDAEEATPSQQDVESPKQVSPVSEKAQEQTTPSGDGDDNADSLRQQSEPVPEENSEPAQEEESNEEDAAENTETTNEKVTEQDAAQAESNTSTNAPADNQEDVASNKEENDSASAKPVADTDEEKDIVETEQESES